MDYRQETIPPRTKVQGFLVSFLMRQRGKFKMILVGDPAVGKTTLINSLNGIDPRKTSQVSTIGASFSSLRFDDYTIDAWDTAGQERYFSLVDMYFRNVDIAFFVYDVNEPETLKSIFQKWIPRFFECREKYNDMARRSILFLIGNKADNPEVQKIANESEFLKSKQNYVIEHNIHHFIVSAWNSRNLSLIRHELKDLLSETKPKLDREKEDKLAKNLAQIRESQQEVKSTCTGCA